MTDSEYIDRPVGRASLYARRRPLLFLALTPAIFFILMALIPASVMGLVLILPGLSGTAGLVGMSMAWIGLLAPGIVERRGGTILLLLAASIPAMIFGLAVLFINKKGVSMHTVDPLMAVGPASVAFAVLAIFFIAGVVAWDLETPTADQTYVRRWRIAGTLVVCLTLPFPVGCLLVAGGYGDVIRQKQATQAEVLSQRAIAAADAYRLAHEGALPPDNASAGLPAPAEMHDTYVASVTLAKGQITLQYRDNAMARMFGAGADDVSLIFTPGEGGSAGWTCLMLGYRLEGDLPLGLHDRCRTP